jgi:6-pyruvoyl-tetrahydropterin synthase
MSSPAKFTLTSEEDVKIKPVVIYDHYFTNDRERKVAQELEQSIEKLRAQIAELKEAVPDKQQAQVTDQLREIATTIEQMSVSNKELKADILLPPMEDMNVRLVRSDTLDRLEEYRMDESKAYLLIGVFGGAIFGILSNWATNETFTITRPSRMLMILFFIFALATTLWAYQVSGRARRVRNQLLYPKGVSDIKQPLEKNEQGDANNAT